jgi:hypothetical protein
VTDITVTVHLIDRTAPENQIKCTVTVSLISEINKRDHTRVDQGKLPKANFRGCYSDSGNVFIIHHFYVCGSCLGSRVWTSLDHSIVSYEKFGSRVDGEAIEKRLQLGPKAVAAQGRDRMKFAHLHAPGS